MITLVKPAGTSEDSLIGFIKKLDSYVYSLLHEMIVLKRDDSTIYRTKGISTLKFLLEILTKTYDITSLDQVIVILRERSDSLNPEMRIKTVDKYLSNEPLDDQMLYTDLFVPIDAFPSTKVYKVTGGMADRWIKAQKSGEIRLADTERTRRCLFAKNVIYSTGVSDLVSGNIDIHSSAKTNETIIESACRPLQFRFLLVRGLQNDELGKIILPHKELWDEEDGIVFAISQHNAGLIECGRCTNGIADDKMLCTYCNGTGKLLRQEKFNQENEKVRHVGKIITTSKKIESSVSSFKAVLDNKNKDIKKIHVNSVFMLDAETHRGYGIGEHIYVAKKDAYNLQKGEKFVIIGFSISGTKHRIVFHRIDKIEQGPRGNSKITLKPRDNENIRTLSLAWYLQIFKKIVIPYEIDV